MVQFLLSNLLNLLLVLGYLSLFVLLPAVTTFHHSKIKSHFKTALILVFGFSLYSLLVYLVRFVGLPFFVAEILLLTYSFILYKKHPLKLKNLKPKLTKTSALIFAIFFAIALIHSAVLLRSAVPTDTGLSFVNLSYHDSTQHLSIIRRLYTNPQPNNPGYSGVPLDNYHYLVDLSIAAITRFSFISLFDTYYRIYPVLISLIFSYTIYAFSKIFFKNDLASVFTVLITIFAGNASFYAQFIRGSEYSWGSNAFIINPIIDLNQNPASIFVLAQMLVSFLIIHLYTTAKKSQKVLFLLPVLATITGTMITFKAWGGLLITATLFVAAAWHFFKTRDPKLFFVWIASLIISLTLFLPGYNSERSASPEWAPGWTLYRMVNDADRWNYLQDIFLLDHYHVKDRPIHEAILYGKWGLIYFFGNYWLRSLGFVAIILLLRKHLKLTVLEVAILSMTLMSFTLPLFFNQGRMSYDIEQFSPYAVILSSVYFVVLLNSLAKTLKKKYPLPKHTGFWFFAIALILLVPSNYTSLRDRTNPHTSVNSYQLMEAFSQAEQLTSPNALFYLYPSHRNYSTLEFAAFANRDTYFSGRTISVITGYDSKIREKDLDRIAKESVPAKLDFFDNQDMTHVFLHTEDLDDFNPIPDEFTEIFSNQAAKIYQIN